MGKNNLIGTVTGIPLIGIIFIMENSACVTTTRLYIPCS